MDDHTDWMLEGARTLPLWDAIDAEDTSWGQDPDFKRLKCPVCGDSYQRVGTHQLVSGNDNYEAGWTGRGHLDVLPVEGECGHKWEVCSPGGNT